MDDEGKSFSVSFTGWKAWVAVVAVIAAVWLLAPWLLAVLLLGAAAALVAPHWHLILAWLKTFIDKVRALVGRG